MAHISRARKQYSQAELAGALERELRTGIKLKEAIEQEREIVAAKEAEEMRMAKTISGLGKGIGMMPHWEFFNLVNKYGYDEVHSKEFHRYHQKRFPHLAGASV